jgi:hypothetical protein
MKLWYGWKAHLKGGLWGLIFGYPAYVIMTSAMSFWLKTTLMVALLMLFTFKDLYPPFRVR